MQKITPALWFDKDMKEILAFYEGALGAKGEIVNVLENTPSGTVEVAKIEIFGMTCSAMTAGPFFKFNPSISFIVMCESKKEVNKIWEKLSEGGTALMTLGSYPFSERYGWIQDRYGLSWQVMSVEGQKPSQRVVPTLMYAGKVCGKAEEAIRFYASVFKDAKVGDLFRYEAGMEPDKEGTIMHGQFTLEGQKFAAMDSAREHDFTFNEAVSFEVRCKDQAEIDYYWSKLSAVPESEQCGWLKDKYGVSWQIVPIDMDRMMVEGTAEQRARVTEAFLKMKKFDLAALERAYNGK